MRVYVDASAAAKLIRDEPESEALASFLEERTEPMGIVSCLLLETELRRVALREGVSQSTVSEVLRGIGLIEIERSWFHQAGLLPGRGLRSLDALHLVTAMKAEADAMVGYDQRLLAASEAVGLPTRSPT